MTLQRSLLSGAALAAAMLVTAAAGLAAQQRPLFEWSGRVDREMELVMRGRSLQLRNVGWIERIANRPRVYDGLPSQDGYVTVQRLDGRGRVDVIEQPNRGNDYTAVVRIRDDRSGDDQYRIAAYWQPAGGGWGRGNGGWDRGRGRDRDDDDRGDRRGDNGRGNGGWNNGGWNNGGWNNGGWNNGGWDNGHGTLHWSGAVDDRIELRIQGRDVRLMNMSGDGVRDVRSSFDGALPRRDVSLHVDKHQGRGQVDVVQQPAAWNGYTAVVRVRDGRGGMGFYDFDVTW